MIRDLMAGLQGAKMVVVGLLAGLLPQRRSSNHTRPVREGNGRSFLTIFEGIKDAPVAALTRWPCIIENQAVAQ
jgi:hypothetical protein